MFAQDRRSRPRRRARHQIGPWTEPLESRRLLVATPINVASGVTFAIASPLPGLVSGMPPTAQTLSSVTATVAPSPVATDFGPTATGPSTTLSPLPNDSETAEATASEVARPTPGRSDRISTVIVTPEIVPLPHIRPPDAPEVAPGPEVQPPAPAQELPAPPAVEPAPPPPPAEPAAPAPPADAAPLPQAAPEEAKEPMAFEAWDAALDLIATESPEGVSVPLAHRVEGAMAAGLLLAAWGGWRSGSRSDGRNRRRPLAIVAVEDDPGR